MTKKTRKGSIDEAARPYILVDIDGTLADNNHRQHLLPDWDAFFAACGGDAPIKPVIELVNILCWDARRKVILVTGRSEICRGATAAWLHRHDVPHDELVMRAAGDHRPDHVVKREMLAALRERRGGDPDYVLDDRDSVVAMWRAEGLTCLQVAADKT